MMIRLKDFYVDVDLLNSKELEVRNEPLLNFIKEKLELATRGKGLDELFSASIDLFRYLRKHIDEVDDLNLEQKVDLIDKIFHASIDLFHDRFCEDIPNYMTFEDFNIHIHEDGVRSYIGSINEMKIRIFKDIAITLSGLTKLNEIAYHLGLSPELLSNTKEVDELLGTLISEKSPHQI